MHFKFITVTACGRARWTLLHCWWEKIKVREINTDYCYYIYTYTKKVYYFPMKIYRTCKSYSMWVMELNQYFDFHPCGLALTLGVQLCTVLGESFEPNPLSQKMKKLLQRRPSRFIVVHFLLAALARHAVHYPHFPLETQLQPCDFHDRGKKGDTVSDNIDILRQYLGWHFKHKHSELFHMMFMMPFPR